MKKLIYLVLILCLLFYCGPKQEKVEKIRKDGVEVVVNHLEPYKIKGEPGTLHLEREFSIDTENEEILKIGLIDIETFDVDDEANIFIIRWRSDENYIFKFNSSGDFIKSFLRFGKGPGEIEWGGTMLISPQGEVIAKDPARWIRKFLVYDREGNFLRETPLEKNYSLIPLENGNYLVSLYEKTPEFRKRDISICNSEFKDINELDTLQWPNPMNARSPVNRDRIIYGASKDKIYIFTVRAKKNRLYCLREKESGYKELVVYRMMWE